MAMVSGRESTLNPNAPPFIPAVYRQEENISSEWWNLVQNPAWFREHEEVSFEEFDDSKDDDIKNLLPDTFDLGFDDFPCVEPKFEEMVESYEAYDRSGFGTFVKPHNSQVMDAAALMANLNSVSFSPKERGPSSSLMVEPARYYERTMQHMSPKHDLRRIHQGKMNPNPSLASLGWV